MNAISINSANNEDIDEILRLLKEAALWLKEKNITYWHIWINPPDNYLDWIKKGFDKNEFYLVKQNNSIIGCFRLSWDDELFWGRQDTSAGYIHSFTIDRKLRGNGIGKRVMRIIENKCLELNKNYLRLDCSYHDDALRKYYERYGFHNVGETTVKGERLTLYEKELFQE